MPEEPTPLSSFAIIHPITGTQLPTCYSPCLSHGTSCHSPSTLARKKLLRSCNVVQSAHVNADGAGAGLQLGCTNPQTHDTPMANDWTYFANLANDEENQRNNDLRNREAEVER